MNKKALVYLAYALAVLFVVIAVIYFITPANQLPGFMPGHDAVSAKTHVKHGLAAAFLALGSIAFAWFQSGPKSSQE